MAIEVVELDGHRVGVFAVAYGSPDVSASASGLAACRPPVCVRSNTPSASIGSPAMTPRRYGPLAYVPINRRPPLAWPSSARRPPLAWPSSARVALWMNPNVEFFGLDDVMPSNLNDRVPRARRPSGSSLSCVFRARQ
jgi:hypothetical protein